MERKDGFMENNISRDKKRMGLKVIQLINLIAFGITNEYRRGGPRSKLISTRLESSSIAKATKRSNGLIGWNYTKQQLIRRFMMKHLRGGFS